LHDIAPTLLEMAAVEHPGRRYKGREVYPMEGQSLTPLLSGRSERIYSESQPIGFEFVDNGADAAGILSIYRAQWRDSLGIELFG
jgi:arylsulfatase A-like enzyme